MTMKPYAILLLITLFSLVSCNRDVGAIDETIGEQIDTVLIDSTLNPIDTVQLDSAGYIDESAALATQIEKVYGEQWDFCDCVVKNDSIEKAIFATDDDAQLDLILARMEVVDQHCKELLTTHNTTPDDRAKHERKVNRCLKDAKNK